VQESRELSRQVAVRPVEVRLRGGGSIQGSITVVAWGTPERNFTAEIPLWECPCGTLIDPEATPEELSEPVTAGFRITCPTCRRRYHVTTIAGRCYGVSEYWEGASRLEFA
jgi:hypothetical protein